MALQPVRRPLHDLPRGPINTKIFITHTHWDHLIGFPFFTPIYIPTSNLDVYAPQQFADKSAKDIFAAGAERPALGSGKPF